MRDRAETLQIMAQTAYKIAGELHAAEIREGAFFDRERLSTLAKEIATDIKNLSGLSGSPSAGEAGGSIPSRSPSAGGRDGSTPSSSAPSCPKCEAPMEENPKWTGLGDLEGHSRAESIRWRCSQRGDWQFAQRRWSGCDGVRWEDAKRLRPA